MFIKLLSVGLVAFATIDGVFLSQEGPVNQHREAAVGDPMTQPDPTSPQAMEQAGLNRVVPGMKFDHLPLGRAIGQLRDDARANIFVNWKALEDAGIDRKKTVTLEIVDHLPLHAALDLLLNVASDGQRTVGWTTDVEPTGERVIVVSAGSNLVVSLCTRVYDVRDLLPAGKESRAARADALMRLVTDTIDPGSWRSHHGDVGAIRELSGSLIVTQSVENHRRIITMLQHLRETFGNKVPAPKKPEAVK